MTFFGSCAGQRIRPIVLNPELPSSVSQTLHQRFKVEEVSALSTLRSKNSKQRLKQQRFPQNQSQVSDPGSVSSRLSQRRLERDPIGPNEKISFDIQYLGIKAGELVLRVLPMKEIQGRKVYHFQGVAVSSPFFSLFYRLYDVAESYMDYDGLFSHRFHLILDETKQKRDALELNDFEKKQTFYWNRWKHHVKGEIETQEIASIPDFSQDSLSAFYYFRHQKFTLNQMLTFPVVSEGKSFEAVCRFLRQEWVSSVLGQQKAWVVQLNMQYQGILKQAGENLLWITDDDRRIPLQLSAKVKIGAVKAILKDYQVSL